MVGWFFVGVVGIILMLVIFSGVIVYIKIMCEFFFFCYMCFV